MRLKFVLLIFVSFFVMLGVVYVVDDVCVGKVFVINVIV